MSSTLDDIQDVRQRAAAILTGHKLRQLEDAGLAVVSKAEWQEQQMALAAMRSALKLALRGAKHESCKFSDDDPDPTWHCCDWNDVVTAIETALQEDAGKSLERRLEVLERVAEAAKVWRNCSIDRLGLATNPEEARAHHVMVHNATVDLTRAVDELEAMEHAHHSTSD